jgi:hypothetical protein
MLPEARSGADAVSHPGLPALSVFIATAITPSSALPTFSAECGPRAADHNAAPASGFEPNVRESSSGAVERRPDRGLGVAIGRKERLHDFIYSRFELGDCQSLLKIR